MAFAGTCIEKGKEKEKKQRFVAKHCIEKVHLVLQLRSVVWPSNWWRTGREKRIKLSITLIPYLMPFVLSHCRVTLGTFLIFSRSELAIRLGSCLSLPLASGHVSAREGERVGHEG